ncbi:ABC transporter substrate-binding protein [Brachybacterium sp. DNPG3]
MINRRQFATGSVLLGALGLGAASCGSGDGGAPDGPVELRMTIWTADEAHLALFQEIADEYVAEHADTVSGVVFETIPFEDYTTTLTTQLSGGSAPDLAWILESSGPEFVDSGALVEVGSTLEAAEGYEYDDIDPSALTLWQNDEGLFAYPFSNSPFCVFLNTTRLQEAEQEDLVAVFDAGEWTYDTAFAVSAASVEALGGAGLVVRDFNYETWDNLASVWAGYGARAWSADGTACEFAEKPMVDAMTALHEAAFATGAMPGPGDDVDFFGGQTTMTITQISRASALDGSFEWDVLPLPAGPATQQNVVGQAGIGVLAQGQAPEIAADFLAHFTSPASAEKLSAFFPPPRLSLLTVEAMAAANPLLDDDQIQRAVVDGITGAITKPAHRNFAELQTTIRSALDPLWTADADIPGVLDEVCTVAQPLLEA